MSREVLGSGESDAETSVPSQRARATVVTDLDRTEFPPTTRPHPRTPPGDQPGPAGAATTANGREPTGHRAPGDGAGVDVDLDAAAAPPVEPPTRAARWWARVRDTPVPLVAAAAVGALLASLVTGGILQRQHAAERYASVRLLADVTFGGSGLNNPSLSGGEPVDVDLVVFNGGQDALQVRTAAIRDGRGASIELREETEVPAGALVRVPARLRLDCSGPQPRQLEVGVRTGDGRDRTLEPTAFNAVPGGVGPLENVWWACSQGAGSDLEIWSTSARDDGTLAMQLRNPSDRDVELAFSGPAGTRILFGDASTLLIGGRDSEFMRLTVAVDRCTSAARRANAADDLVMTVNGDSVGAPPADFALLAGWLARQVALTCG